MSTDRRTFLQAGALAGALGQVTAEGFARDQVVETLGESFHVVAAKEYAGVADDFGRAAGGRSDGRQARCHTFERGHAKWLIPPAGHHMDVSFAKLGGERHSVHMAGPADGNALTFQVMRKRLKLPLIVIHLESPPVIGPEDLQTEILRSRGEQIGRPQQKVGRFLDAGPPDEVDHRRAVGGLWIGGNAVGVDAIVERGDRAGGKCIIFLDPTTGEVAASGRNNLLASIGLAKTLLAFQLVLKVMEHTRARITAGEADGHLGIVLQKERGG